MSQRDGVSTQPKDLKNWISDGHTSSPMQSGNLPSLTQSNMWNPDATRGGGYRQQTPSHFTLHGIFELVGYYGKPTTLLTS